MGKSPQKIINVGKLWQGDGAKVRVNAAIGLADDEIVYIGDQAGAKKAFANAEIVDLGNVLAIPGFVDSHCHTPMALFRGIVHTLAVAATSKESSIIEDIFFPVESHLKPQDVEMFAYSSIIDGIKSGVTTFFDSYFFMPEFAKAFERIGARAFVGEHIADRGGPIPSGRDKWLATKKCIENWPFSTRIRPMVYAHAADTVSPSLLKELSDYSIIGNLPFHMHLSQTYGERARVLKTEGMSPVSYAESLGVLRQGAIVTHLVSADETDLKRIGDSGATVAYCPTSEIFYEALPPIDLFDRHNIPVAIGTDCSASNDSNDIMQEMKVAAILHKKVKGTQEIDPGRILASVTTIPARACGAKIGYLGEGYKADICFLQPDIGVMPEHNLPANLVYSYRSRHVKHVLIDGKWVLQDGIIQTVNEGDLAEKFASAFSSFVKRTSAFRSVEKYLK
ncbi:MAG: amidohydrolase family protein [Oligoflexales bacterium]